MNREQKEKAVWRKTHKDFKGVINGEKFIMLLRNGGSCLAPLASLTEEELDYRLPKEQI